MTTTMNNEVLKGLRAFESGIEDGQPDGAIMKFYDLVSAQLSTNAEKVAYKKGALAIAADAEGKRFRSLYHAIKFRRAMKKLDK